MSIMASSRPGERCASISPGCASRGWASIWRRTLGRDAMHDGGVGVSTSREYAPAMYAKTDELIALAAEAGKLGGIYASHIRDEGDGILPALDEAIQIGREGHLPVELWHLKAAGR